MDGMEYTEYEEIPAEGASETPGDFPAEDAADTPAAPPVQGEETPGEYPPASDQGDAGERLSDLLEQIGAGPSYGSMGDYYIADAGCYAFPSEEVFFYFIGEAERSGWAAASNGCYVPAGSLEAYEAYLSSGYPGEDAEGEELPPPVTQEDLSGLTETLQAMYERDALHYEAVTLHMETTEKALEDNREFFSNIFAVSLVICFFLALFCGAYVADVFWKRMRAG